MSPTLHQAEPPRHMQVRFKFRYEYVIGIEVGVHGVGDVLLGLPKRRLVRDLEEAAQRGASLAVESPHREAELRDAPKNLRDLAAPRKPDEVREHGNTNARAHVRRTRRQIAPVAGERIVQFPVQFGIDTLREPPRVDGRQAGADALELNVSFHPISLAIPSTEYEDHHLKILKAVKKEVSIPISIKLMSQITSVSHLGQQLAESGCDAIVLFNWFLEPDIDIETMKTRSLIGKANFFHSLRVFPEEDGVIRNFEELGTGQEQLLALVFAHAYAKAFYGGIVLVIEEPEAHLHPLAQQWLAYKINEMASDGLQIILSTHSSAFVNLLNLGGICLVKKIENLT